MGFTRKTEENENKTEAEGLLLKRQKIMDLRTRMMNCFTEVYVECGERANHLLLALPPPNTPQHTTPYVTTG
jgi:hypothetical protein